MKGAMESLRSAAEGMSPGDGSQQPEAASHSEPEVTTPTEGQDSDFPEYLQGDFFQAAAEFYAAVQETAASDPGTEASEESAQDRGQFQPHPGSESEAEGPERDDTDLFLAMKSAMESLRSAAESVSPGDGSQQPEAASHSEPEVTTPTEGQDSDRPARLQDDYAQAVAELYFKQRESEAE